MNVEYTEFLEQRVSLNMDRLCRISNIVLSRPVAATRCDLGGGLFSQPKLHHMIRLREDGWYDGTPAVAYEPGGPDKNTMNTKGMCRNAKTRPPHSRKTKEH